MVVVEDEDDAVEGGAQGVEAMQNGDVVALGGRIVPEGE